MSGARGGPTYRFVQELASGGMGRVELVVRREGTFARAYARKRPLGDLAFDGRVRDMLLEEARVAGLVRNAHVVPVLDVGEDEEGVFLIMEFVDGVPLDTIIERLGARLPLQCLVEIARQISEGIHAVHEMTTTDGAPMEIVHRDLTPSNVLVGFDGIVRVTDFGIARARDRAALSRPGVRKGKRSYMAPEQLRAEEVDRRADLFALGIVLGEMTAGGRLYGDVTPAERARHTLEEPPPDIGELRADVPPELVALAFELMARQRDDRPRDARLVAGRLAAIRDQLRIEEGSIDLGELVRARFDELRRSNDRMLANALRDQDPTVQIEAPADDTTQVTGPVSELVSLHALSSDELVPAEPSAVEPATQPWKLPVTEQAPGARAVDAWDLGDSTARVERGRGVLARDRATYAALGVLGAVVIVSAATIWWVTRAGEPVAPTLRAAPPSTELVREEPVREEPVREEPVREEPVPEPPRSLEVASGREGPALPGVVAAPEPAESGPPEAVVTPEPIPRSPRVGTSRTRSSGPRSDGPTSQPQEQGTSPRSGRTRTWAWE